MSETTVVKHQDGICPVCKGAVEESYEEVTSDRGTTEYGAFDYRSLGLTPLQAAALAALVAWREADVNVEAVGNDARDWSSAWNAFLVTQRELKDAADRLISAEVGT